MPPELTVRADRDQLYRVLLNLARNAVEAGAHHLRFAAATENGTVAVEIADDGPGLPPRARENLFRPFFGSARPGGTRARPGDRPRIDARAGRRIDAARDDRRRYDIPPDDAGRRRAGPDAQSSVRVSAFR